MNWCSVLIKSFVSNHIEVCKLTWYGKLFHREGRNMLTLLGIVIQFQTISHDFLSQKIPHPLPLSPFISTHGVTRVLNGEKEGRRYLFLRFLLGAVFTAVALYGCTGLHLHADQLMQYLALEKSYDTHILLLHAFHLSNYKVYTPLPLFFKINLLPVGGSDTPPPFPYPRPCYVALPIVNKERTTCPNTCSQKMYCDIIHFCQNLHFFYFLLRSVFGASVSKNVHRRAEQRVLPESIYNTR